MTYDDWKAREPDMVDDPKWTLADGQDDMQPIHAFGPNGSHALMHPRFALYNSDTIDVARTLPDESVDYSIFSPPFASLYTYSNSPRDLGNVRSYEDFWEHFRFLTAEQFRVMAIGRLVSIHCMLLPTTLERDGKISLRDFRGDIIRAYERAGFLFHSEACIQKDPVVQMVRTHAIGLLHKQLKADSSRSRMALADYVVTMLKPGKNAKPITHTDESFPVPRWQRYASPIWTDIDQSDTLQGHRDAKEEEDEKHITPLQLGVIRRCIDLWTNPDDVVWSPFAGIGSEGYVALQKGRRFVGAELKGSYYEQACRNLTEAATVQQGKLFEKES